MNETGTVQASGEQRLTVSVVTCCYNQGSFLAANIESVLSQNYPVLEHIIVDDGSTDDTRDVCSRYPGVTYLYQQNAGQSAALNHGFSKARGDVIIWLNSDDALAPEAIAAVVPLIQPEKGEYIVMGHAHAVAPDGGFLWKMNTRKPEFMRLLFHPLLYRKRGIVCMPCQPALFFHRTVYETLGHLDCSLKYGMDYDYWLRAFEAGFTFTHTDQVLALYRYHPTSNSAQGFDLFLPEWQRVSSAHLRRLSFSARLDAERARVRFYRESARCRRHNAYSENVYGINRHLRVHRRPEEVDVQTALHPSPKIDVILYGDAESVDRSSGTIRSLLSQRYPHWTLWMDESAVRHLPEEEKRALLVEHAALVHTEHDLKTARQAIETALHQTQGEYTAFIRMGDCWHPEKLEQQVVYMARRPSVAATYTKSECLSDGERNEAAGGRMCGSEPPPERMPLFMQLLTEEIHFSFSSVMVRRDALPEIRSVLSCVSDASVGRLLLACIAAGGVVDWLSGVLSGHQEAEGETRTDEQKALNRFMLQSAAAMYLARQSPEARRAGGLATRLLLPRSLFSVMSSEDAAAKQQARAVCFRLLFRYPVQMCRAWAQWRMMQRDQKNPVIRDRFRHNEECLAASAKLVERLRRQGISEVVLYGAGKHTRRLLELHALAPLKIASIMDDQPAVAEIQGIPVCGPSSFSQDRKKEVVVIPSSDTAQSVLMKKAKKLGFNRIERIYTSA